MADTEEERVRIAVLELQMANLTSQLATTNAAVGKLTEQVTELTNLLERSKGAFWFALVFGGATMVIAFLAGRWFAALQAAGVRVP